MNNQKTWAQCHFCGFPATHVGEGELSKPTSDKYCVVSVEYSLCNEHARLRAADGWKVRLAQSWTTTMDDSIADRWAPGGGKDDGL